MAPTTPRIAIIGAGPGGLMLASILSHNDIPCIIYERDSSAGARCQGGTLDIHEHSGQQALNAAGLLDEFRAAMRQGGDAMRILKKDGTVLFEDSGETISEPEPNQDSSSKFVKGRPEIDRAALKEILIASLPVGTIHWGSKVISISPVPDSAQWTLELSDGSRPAPFDIVVGADGAWSRTRALLTDQQPFYSGVTALDVGVYRVDEAAPEVSAFVGMGNCFIWAKDRALLFQRNGQGRDAEARCYACVKTSSKTAPSARALLGEEEEEDDGAEVDWMDAHVRERYVERYFGDWDPEVKRILLSMADKSVLRPLYMMPVGLTWEPRPGVTLVGDAAHLMTPFAGVGVNVALMDAFELAQGITDCVKAGSTDGDALAAMLQRYEKGMFTRSAKETARTEASMHLQFQEDGAERMIRIMTGRREAGDPELQ
ncbi:hypothetical protein F5Y01DRAFT_329039 [Xylaria sp. FL0043]|nr:hypothetical protein F5Y01DRAFT_329039 [Xylaria sp. FL0043]